VRHGRDGSSGPEPARAGPVHTLLRFQTELRLTATQVTQLQRIDQETDELNRPLVSGLREIRGRVRALGPMDSLTPEQQATFDSYMAEARPLMKGIEQNNCAAMQQVGNTLTEAQKERLSVILRGTNRNRERSRPLPRLSCSGN
jgi:hypothetical protein